MWLALIIFVTTVVLVIWQPKGLGIGWSASLGAVASLLAGTVQLADILIVWQNVWNATITFIAIIMISLLLDEAGFFEWIALHVAHLGKGCGKRLFTYIVLLGAGVSFFFANDGAALILTPIVIAILLALKFEHKATLAFVMAAGFIADTASLPLVISNLVNIVSADFFKINFNTYASIMIPVNLVAVFTTLLVLKFYFYKDIPHRYSITLLTEPSSVIKDPLTFKSGGFILIFLLIGFFGLNHFGIPVSLVASISATILFIVAKKGKIINTARVIKNAPWHIVVFSLGMYLVVYGLKNVGLTEFLANILSYLAQKGIWVATLGTGFLTAFISSIMNNMPTVLLGVISIDESAVSGSIREAMSYANVIGCDLGPKITPIGSLATLLWLHILAKKEIKITWGYYFKVGILLTVPILLATLSALVIRLTI